MSATESIDTPSHPDPMYPLRVACIAGSGMVMLVSIYLLLQIGESVRSVLTNPVGLAPTVEGFANLIDATHLSVVQKEGNRVEFGKLAANALAIAWYALWAWIPLAMLHGSGSILVQCLADRNQIKTLLKELLTVHRAQASRD